MDYDLITIGAGGGAYPAAFRLARLGLKILMVDSKGVMSGNCLAEGCVPSKSVREVAEHWERQRRFSSFGLKGDLVLDFERMMNHKDSVQKVRYQQHDGELSRTPGLSLLKGKAKMVSKHDISVLTDDGERLFRGKHILIASGSDVFIPPIPGANLCLTSHDLYKMNSAIHSCPSSVIVIGGGYVGLETATFFAAFGSSVTVLELGDQLLPGIDSEIVSMLVPQLSSLITPVLSAQVLSVTSQSEGKKRVKYRHNQTEVDISAEMVFMAAGRRPVIPDGAREAGVVMGPRGIEVDDRMRTNVPHVFACGDVNGRTPLFHAAVRQSLVCAHQIMGGEHASDRMDFGSVPTTVFTLPAASYVGLTPSILKERSIPFKRATYFFEEDSRAQIFGETAGGIHLFFHSETLKLLGGYVVGIDAENLIGEIGLAVSAGLSAMDLASFADQHPMASEGISKAARSLF
ncbi:dihydrolipoyl dehydrogenase [Leptospirillum ferrooxidans]|jgi:dihydrolipoamide dehydrogenase|uniref:Putative dihydrolipoamide dehydrogenase n=1 Tax=Leptospirillum ferrooxidans (strain C2-3) TaxID=1162668 RepID=I0IQA3_LEPFC|nr:dihydrolipoyl dehydrogenase [Leptospirillum ferrooxidans]BAM07452.1 putative dihydrolipoamide dehydrogenase [Leptospirillum ferrooxidans C2-3]